MELLDCRQADQRAGVAFTQPAVRDGGLDSRLQLEQAECVRDRRSGSANLSGDLVLGQAEFLAELAKGVRLLDRVEIFPLDVLDQGQLELFPIGQLPNDGRDPHQAGHSCGLDAALTGHDPIAIERLGHEDRLEDAVVADARRQRLEVGVLDVPPGLVRIDLNVGEGDVVRRRWQRRPLSESVPTARDRGLDRPPARSMDAPLALARPPAAAP